MFFYDLALFTLQKTAVLIQVFTIFFISSVHNYSLAKIV